MGQKINPRCFRLLHTGWPSEWYANKASYGDQVCSDWAIREYLSKTLKSASVAKIIIQRKPSLLVITVHASKPGIIIGKRGSDLDKIKSVLVRRFLPKGADLEFNIVEFKKPETNAVLIADNVARQIEKRASFRRVMKKTVQSCLHLGAKGIKISCAGRLAGAEIARTEWYREGKVPLHSIRANIEYGTAEAMTSYGVIGIKVWVYHGDSVVEDN